MDERSARGPVNRLGRFAASGLTLLVVAVGAPVAAIAVATARFGGASPLAGVPPPWRWQSGALTQRLTEDAVVDVIVRLSLLALWGAVAVIVATTIAEVAHQVRHRGLEVPAVRGLGWAQPISRFIAAGFVAVIPLAPAAASLADTPGLAARADQPVLDEGTGSRAVSTPQGRDVARTGAVVDAADRADGSAFAPAVTSTTQYTVRPGDSVFSIATAHASGPDEVMRVADLIIEANLDRPMGDGQRFTTPAYIEAGWVLDVPGRTVPTSTPAAPERSHDHVAAPVHVVVPGDTLWDIAAARLGDPLAWTSIWELNQGTTMNDGNSFDDPDLILPGWQLRLTADVDPEGTGVERDRAEDPGRFADRPGDGATPVSGPLDDALDDALDVPSEVGSTVTALDARSERDDRAPRSDEPDQLDGAVAVGPVDDAPDAADTAVEPDAEPATAPDATNVASSTTHVPVGDVGDGTVDDDPDRPAVTPLRLEHAALIAAGILAIVAVARRRRLRAGEPRHRVPEPLPEVRDTERRLRSIDPGARAERIDVACRAIAASIADSGHRIGSMSVDDDGALRVRTTGAVDLAAPWSGGGCVWRLAADVPVEILAPDARRVDMPCPALVQLGLTEGGEHLLVDLEACGLLDVHAPAPMADQVVTAIAVGLASSIHAEIAHLIGTSLSPGSLLGHRNAHISDSPTAAIDLATALVGTTSDNASTTFELRCRRTGGEMWEPAIVLLTSDDADELGRGDSDALRSLGRGVVVVAGGATTTAPATLAATPGGWQFRAFGETIPLRPIGVDDTDLAAVAALLDDAHRDLETVDELCWAGDDRSTDPEPLAPADGFADRRHEIVIGLLGGVTITDRDGVPGDFERSKTVELIAWLATHRDRSTRSSARTALWELDVRDATFANVVSEARRGLARLVKPPDDEEWVARTLSDDLPLHELVVTDADLVADRLDRARLEPPAQAVETLRPAVALIRDLPFAGTSYLWPDAEGITSNLVLLAIGAATEFAAHALSLGDTEGVFWATGQGLKVLPGHEELVGLRMQAHARTGDLAGVRHEWASYERVLIADPWTDGEPAPKLVALRRQLLESATNS